MTSSEKQAQAAVGMVLEGKYRLERELGAGGMGVVYLAQHETIERKVAIKVLHQDLAADDSVRRRFETEAKAIARLQHPNCVMLYEFGLSDELEALFAVFEYVEGHSLETWVGQSLPLSDVVELGRQITSGIDHAHDNNIIHRDLKPENIMIVPNGEGDGFELKLLDFGIARIAEEDEKRTRLTKMGQMFGTPPYMSPEQVRAKLNVTYATDIYSIGVILYEMIEGELPFLGDTPIETVMMHLNEEVPPMTRSGVPDALRDIVMRCLEKEAEDRFDSCGALMEALESIEINETKPSVLARPTTARIVEDDAAPQESGDETGSEESDEAATTDDEITSAPTLLADGNEEAADADAVEPTGDDDGDNAQALEPEENKNAAQDGSPQEVTTQDLDDDDEIEEVLVPESNHKVVLAVLVLVLGVGGVLAAVILTSVDDEPDKDNTARAQVEDDHSSPEEHSDDGGESPDDELAAVDDDENSTKGNDGVTEGEQEEMADDELPDDELSDIEDDEEAEEFEDTEVAEEPDVAESDPAPAQPSPSSAPDPPQEPTTSAQHQDDDAPDAPAPITLPAGGDDDDEAEDEPAPAPEGIGLPQPD